MTPLKRTGLLFFITFFLISFAQPHVAEAQLLKKLKDKAARKAQEKLEKKAEEKIDRAMDSSIDTVYARTERLFGLRSRGDKESTILNQGKAGGFATISFADESYSHNDFKDVVCTFFANGVSIDAIVNEQYGVIFELINVPINSGGHKGTYASQAYSSNNGMLGNFEYYTRPDIPARVGSILKEGTISVTSLDNTSVFFSFEGSGGNAETNESINMQGTVKLDFSLVFQSDDMIQNNYSGKRIHTPATEQSPETIEKEASTEEGPGHPNAQAEQAMAMMQQMTGNTTNIKVPDSYTFDYHIKYEMTSVTGSTDSYDSWVSANENVTMISTGENDEKMIMDEDREALITLDDKEKMAFVMSSKFAETMAMAQNQNVNDTPKNSSLKKTGNSKQILGYKSDEYAMQTPNNQGKVTFWVTNEINIRHNGQIPGLSGFMYGAGLGKEVEGMFMEMHAIEASGEEYHLKMVAFEKVNKKINMNEYKVSKGMGN